MPTYEYKCQECHEVFEVFQSIKADALATHNQCEGVTCEGKVERQIYGGTGFIFKAGGFPSHTDKIEHDSVFKMQRKVYEETR